MSWGVDIKINHSDGYVTWVDVVSGHTYNLTPMWRESGAIPAGEGSDWFDGKTCAALQDVLRDALVETWRRPDDFRVLEPANGWGDFDGFVMILTRFASLVHQHPTGVVAWNG